ncbi:cytochrome P450 [Saccharopolyspora pogona]|uniref:cytochrome P450 n=1 Tax=Saccharopolyspora pogona TaxID=333966 RepID=UPI0016825DFF|nr:cytochrome P450 [Saccharopolyspora pogona]
MTRSQPIAVPLADGSAELFDWLARMRDEHPVWQEGEGAYHVFRYADVARVVSEPAVFSNDASRVNLELANLVRGNINSMDPPEHGKLRKLVSQAFTPRTVAGLAPRIAELTAELLDRVEDDEFDLVDALTFPLPVIVIAELLGVPASDRDLFRCWIDRLLSLQGLSSREEVNTDSPDFLERIIEATHEMDGYLLEHCRDRRRNPQDDLISKLTLAEVEGERLTDDEVVKFANVLFAAGNITTTLLLGNAVMLLDGSPQVAELRANRSLLAPVIEEVLRLRPPFTTVSRVTTREVEVAGTVIPANRMITPWLMSANQDERRFPDARRFDVHRDAGQHLAFSRGIHFCLGAPLARMEAKIALGAMLDRYADIAIRWDEPISYHERGIWGAKTVPVRVRRN